MSVATGVAKLLTSKKFLFGLGVTGVVLTGATAVTGTVLAHKHLVEAGEKKLDSFDKEEVMDNPAIADLTKVESFKAVWKDFVPCITVAGLTIYTFSRFYSQVTRENAALTSLLAASQSTVTHLETKMIDKIGEKKAAPIIREAHEEAIAENPAPPELPPAKTIMIDQNGEAMLDFIDPMSKARFKATKRTIDKAVEQVNLDLHDYGKASFGEFLENAGYEGSDAHELYGWTMDNFSEYKIEAIIDGPGAESIVYDGKPYVCLKFSTPPTVFNDYERNY